MGSPLGPTFADFFMDEFENEHFSDMKRLGVKCWLRYVDDTFVILNDKSQVHDLIKYLCNQHENIKFTFECETKDGLPFLDTRVKRKKSKLVTVLYHKKTFTGTYLNWNSLTDRKYKVGLIYCLMDRIWKICPEQETRELEVSKLKVILAKNDYPSAIIEKEINKFLKNRQSQISVTADTEPTRANNNNVKYIVLPHVNNKVIEFGKRLKKFVENNFIDVEL
jgi:hypothetical protein